PGSPTHEVVSEGDEPPVEHGTRAQTSDGHAHAVTLPCVEPRLWPVRKVAENERPRLRRRQRPHMLRTLKPAPGLSQIVSLDTLFERHRYEQRVPVHHRHARRLRTDRDTRAKNLQRFGFQLLFLSGNERDDVRKGVE